MTSKNGLYTVYLKISSSENTPVTNATVVINPVSKKNQLRATTDNTGTVHFSNLQQGIYDAIVMENNTKAGESVINVNGLNHILTLGINITAQKNNPLMRNTNPLSNILSLNPIMLIGILVVGIIVGVGIAVLVIKLLGKKK